MRKLVILGVAAAALAGCQTPQDSMLDAELTCEYQGYRPGTRAYRECRGVNYVENRVASRQAADAAAVGVAAGLVGGAVIAASARPRYYGYGYGYPRYYRRGYW